MTVFSSWSSCSPVTIGSACLWAARLMSVLTFIRREVQELVAQFEQREALLLEAVHALQGDGSRCSDSGQTDWVSLLQHNGISLSAPRTPRADGTLFNENPVHPNMPSLIESLQTVFYSDEDDIPPPPPPEDDDETSHEIDEHQEYLSRTLRTNRLCLSREPV